MLTDQRSLRALALPLAGGLLVAIALAGLSPRFMDHWDEYQLSYAVDDFDLNRHQPHPPGYYLFVVLGRLLQPLAGEASTALQWASALAVGIAVIALAHAMPRELAWASRVAMLLASMGFAVFSPLVMIYGSVGLSYAAEATAWLLLCLAIASHPQGSRLVGLAFAIGLAGGLRQTLLVWGVALLGIEAVRQRGFVRFRDAPKLILALAGGISLWALPLLYEAGGPAAWWAASQEIALGNIWSKSLVHTGFEGLESRAKMLQHLWLGLGPLVLLMGILAVARLRGALKPLDPLLFGGLLPLLFYAFLTL